MRYAVDFLEQWTTAILATCNMPEADARLAAATLVRSELRGYRTHGLTRIASYMERLRSGEFNPRPAMRHESFPGGIVLDADGAMGQVAGPHAVSLGLEALAGQASVLITLRECGHLGALGIHALIAAEAGAFCMLGQRTPPMLAMEGFAHAAIGHNPVAFGCPNPGGPPIVFDIACSVAARGHMLLAAREGKPIPQGWAVDESGKPTTDARRALKGALLPMGGHKGLGMAMMIECLAGAMAANAASLAPAHNAVRESGAGGRQSGFLWMVRPAAFVDETLFRSYMAQWAAHYLEAGGDQARLPGARGACLEAEGRDQGIEISGAIVAELSALGGHVGIAFPA